MDQSTSDGYFELSYWLDAKARIIDTSEASARVLGYSREELLSFTLADIAPAVGPRDWQSVLERLRVAGEHRIETLQRGKDGSETSVSLRLSLYARDERPLVCVFVRRRDRQLQRGRQVRLQALLDNFPFLVWLKDPEGRFLAVNKPFADAAGVGESAALYGKTDFDAWPCDLAEAYRADDREAIRAREKKLVEEQVVFGRELRWVETYKAPVEDADGTLLGTVGFARDISYRKRAELELQASEQRFRRYFELGVIARSSRLGARENCCP